MAIDNPFDKVRDIIGEEDDELLGALMQVGGVFEPITAIASVVNAESHSAVQGEAAEAKDFAPSAELKPHQ
jgi:hypothetical protein